MTGRNWPWVLWNIRRDLIASAKQLPGAGLVQMTKYSLRSVRDAYLYIFKGETTDMVRDLLKAQALIVDQFGVDKGDRLQFKDDMEYQFAKFRINSLRESKSVKNTLKNAWNWTEKFANFSEVLAKIAGKKYLDEHTSLSEAEKIHLVITRAGSPDFKSGGAYRQIYNNVWTFSNAPLVGAHAALEAFQDNPWSYAIKTFFYDIVPLFLQMAASAGLFGRDLQKFFAKIPKAWRRYIVIPLGFTKAGEAIAMVMPRDFIGDTLSMLLWAAFEDIPKGEFDQLTKVVYGELPFARLNPVLKAIWHTAEFLKGDNPTDSWSGRKVVDEMVMAQGPWQKNPDAVRQFMKAQWNSLVGGWIPRFENEGLGPVRDEAFKVLRAPFMGPLFRRFIQVTKAGEYDQTYRNPAVVEENQKDAKTSLAIHRQIEKALEALGNHPTDREIDRALNKAWSQAQRDKILPEGYHFGYYRNRWQRAATYRFGTPYQAARLGMTKKEQAILDKEMGIK
jgi:hypothetical protein